MSSKTILPQRTNEAGTCLYIVAGVECFQVKFTVRLRSPQSQIDSISSLETWNGVVICHCGDLHVSSNEAAHVSAEEAIARQLVQGSHPLWPLQQLHACTMLLPNRTYTVAMAYTVAMRRTGGGSPTYIRGPGWLMISFLLCFPLCTSHPGPLLFAPYRFCT